MEKEAFHMGTFRLTGELAAIRKGWSRSWWRPDHGVPSFGTKGWIDFGTKKWIEAPPTNYGLKDTCILLLGKRKKWAGPYRLRKDMERILQDEARTKSQGETSLAVDIPEKGMDHLSED